jgi:DNA-binding NtrC family response regulator
MNGLEVMKAVKQINAETDVIMMTGYASKDSAIEALNLGASAYLEKPFDLPALVAKVDSVLANQRERIRKRHFLQVIKERNSAFLTQYKQIRTDLETWLALRGVHISPRQKKTGT